MQSSTKRLEEIKDLLTRLQKDIPDQIGAFQKFMMATETSTALGSKQVNLINVSLAVAAQCEWCIALHVKGALGAGASKEEIIEASMLAVLMHGGPALMQMVLVEEAIEEFTQDK